MKHFFMLLFMLGFTLSNAGAKTSQCLAPYPFFASITTLVQILPSVEDHVVVAVFRKKGISLPLKLVTLPYQNPDMPSLPPPILKAFPTFKSILYYKDQEVGYAITGLNRIDQRVILQSGNTSPAFEGMGFYRLLRWMTKIEMIKRGCLGWSEEIALPKLSRTAYPKVRAVFMDVFASDTLQSFLGITESKIEDPNGHIQHLLKTSSTSLPQAIRAAYTSA